jgi:hypothetical protein
VIAGQTASCTGLHGGLVLQHVPLIKYNAPLLMAAAAAAAAANQHMK